MEDVVVARWVGPSGRFVAGLPARDIKASEYAALSDADKDRLRVFATEETGGDTLYELVTAEEIEEDGGGMIGGGDGPIDHAHDVDVPTMEHEHAGEGMAVPHDFSPGTIYPEGHVHEHVGSPHTQGGEVYGNTFSGSVSVGETLVDAMDRSNEPEEATDPDPTTE